MKRYLVILYRSYRLTNTRLNRVKNVEFWGAGLEILLGDYQLWITRKNNGTDLSSPLPCASGLYLAWSMNIYLGTHVQSTTAISESIHWHLRVAKVQSRSMMRSVITHSVITRTSRLDMRLLVIVSFG